MQARLITLVAALAIIFASPNAALAHAVLLSAEPADGALLNVAPEEARIVFNEPIELLSVRLVGPGGGAIEIEAGLLNGATIIAPLPADLGNGTYAVSWRGISDDGHPLSGSIIFSVGTPGGGIAFANGDWALDASIWIARALFYAGLFIGAGGAAFACWAGAVPAAARKYIWTALAAGSAAAVLGVGLQGADALGLGLAGLAETQVWTTGLAAGFGLQAMLGALAMIVAAVSLSSRRAPFVVAVPIVALVGASIAATGHASTADPQWLTRPAAFVHASAVAFWIGSLLPLSFVLADSALEPLRRFSQVIPFPVLALLLSGSTLVVVQLGPPSASWLSLYSLVLVTKLLLVAAIFVLALRNRYALTGRSLAGDAAAARKLRRAVILETLLVLIVLLAVAAWRFTPPPRAWAEADFTAAAAYGHAMQPEAMADLALEPTGEGSARLTLMLWDPAQLPLEAQEVLVRLSEPLLGVEPFRRVAQPRTPGLWIVPDIDLPAPGLWKLEIEILVSDFESLTLRGELQIESE